MSKKLFIFSLIFFLASTGILFFANFALAGNIRGDCYCMDCSEIGSGKSAAVADSIVEAATRSELESRCRTSCPTMTSPAPYCLQNVSCVITGETINSSGVCTAPTTSGSASETKTSESKTEGVKAISLPNPLGTTDIRVIIGRIIKAVMGIIGSIALALFMYGGFLWMTAAGDPAKVKKGQQTIIAATIGLAIIFLSYTLVNFVLSSLTGLGEETEQEE
jgi:hypothetical protein